MSYSKNLNNDIKTLIDKTMMLFIEQVSKTHKLNKEELVKLWNKDDNTIVHDTSCKEVDEDSQISKNIKAALNKLTKAELVERCKIKGLKISGTKAQLIDLLTNVDLEKKVNNEVSSIKKSPSVKKVSPKTLSKPIIKKLIDKIPDIIIKRNKFNNYEHSDTGFIFNNKTKQVIGKQNLNGNIDELTEEDIDLCNKYAFNFIIPSNLDKKLDLKDVEVEELDEDEDVELENEIIEEEDVEEEEENEEDFEEEEEEEFEDEYFEE